MPLICQLVPPRSPRRTHAHQVGYHTWEHTPTYRGFDTWLGYYNADEDYFTYS